MARLPQLLLLCLAALALTACGQARPAFPTKLDATNSLKVTIRAEGEGPMQLTALQAYYVAEAKSCYYTPRAFVIVKQSDPVPSTKPLSVPVQQVGPSEFSARVPLPGPDGCNWAIRYIAPSIATGGLTIAGIRFNAFIPSMTVTGKSYLPEGQLTYYCALFHGESRGLGPFGTCQLSQRADTTTTLHIRIVKK